MSESNSIKPHGGVLVNRINKVDPTGLFSITITEDLANDVENIADGIFSPLEGFLGQQDFESVISRGRLSNDLAWTIPIVLDVDEDTASKIGLSFGLPIVNSPLSFSACTRVSFSPVATALILSTQSPDLVVEKCTTGSPFSIIQTFVIPAPQLTPIPV